MEIFFLDTNKYSLDDDILKTFAQTSSKKHHCYGRFLIKKIAEDFYKNKNSEIEIINKKPKFKYSDLNFSISHCANIVLAAFDKNPIGVDIEQMKNRDFISILKRFNINGENYTKEMFYQFWTEYEAKVKLQEDFKTKISMPFSNNFILTVVGNFDKNFKVFELTQNGFTEIIL